MKQQPSPPFFCHLSRSPGVLLLSWKPPETTQHGPHWSGASGSGPGWQVPQGRATAYTSPAPTLSTGQQRQVPCEVSELKVKDQDRTELLIPHLPQHQVEGNECVKGRSSQCLSPVCAHQVVSCVFDTFGFVGALNFLTGPTVFFYSSKTMNNRLRE